MDYATLRVVARYQRKTAGYSYGTQNMSVLFVEGRRPFNNDTIRAINGVTIGTIADDGNTYDVNLRVTGHQSSGPLTFQQEKAGEQRETRVDIEYPVDEGGNAKTSARAAMAQLVRLGKKLGFTVEPSKLGYRPTTRK